MGISIVARCAAVRFVAVFILCCGPVLVTHAEEPLQACALVSKADFERITARTTYFEPEQMSLAGGAGSLCEFESGQLWLYPGDKSGALWESVVKGFGNQDDPRTPVEGLGDRAYSFSPTPRNEYQDTGIFIVVTQGDTTLVASVMTVGDEPVESVRPLALELARFVLAKLP
jgi:hypothetical protein